MRVLIVDDNLTNRELLRAILESCQQSVCEAADGLEAIALLERETVDAVISDILMPRMDGYRLCLELRKSPKFSALPFIFYTSTYTSAADEKTAMDLGAHKFLRKPASAKDLMEALQEAVARAPQGQAQAPPASELDLVREYNQRLVEKLEEKHHKLEEETQVLQTTQERLRHVLRLSQAVIYSLRPLENHFRVAWVSENVSQLLGYELAEASQPDWWSQNLHPADRDPVEAGRSRLLSEGRAALEYRFRRKDGQYRWLRDEQRVVWGAEGAATEIVGTAVDITEFRELQELLRQSQKLEAIGRLAGGVAHDFNNLLAVIRGNVELVLMDASQLSSETEECLKAAEAAVERAASLTQQLLAFGRRRVMQAQTLDLNDVIANLVKMLARIIGGPIEMSCRYSAEPSLVRADAGMMEQVIINLVVNARDAMPEGGQLVITTERVQIDREHAETRPESRVGEFTALTVSDTGVGISPEHLPRIFEPFFSTKDVGKGTGLGLATVYGIVKQHQGWIEVSSRPGAGSAFRIFLPALKVDAPIGAPKASSSEPLPGGSETILLVEDDEAVRSSIRRQLERVGYRVQEAASGREALQSWSGRLREIDLVLTDVLMPEGVNGDQMARRLRARRPDLKVVFMSGYSGPLRSNVSELINPQAPLLEKPCSSQQLLRTVRQCLEEA